MNLISLGKLKHQIIFIILALPIISCSSGNNGGNNKSLAMTASSVNIKTIQLDWSAYDGATKYKLFVNPDGVSGFSLIEDNIVGTSTQVELPVHLTDWVNASYILEAHDATSKLATSASVSISSFMISSIGYIKSSNSEYQDAFGYSVSLSSDGNTMAVGAFLEDSNATGISTDGTGEGNNSALDAGAVYVFSRTGSAWSQQAYLKASNSAMGDHFGYSVSLSSDGNTLAVGAFYEDSNATGISTDGSGESDNSAAESGAVYMFTRSGTSWSQLAYIKASNTDIGDQFGYKVRLSSDGNTLAVAARKEDSNATGISTDGTGEANNSALESGAVYIFSRSGSLWSQQAYIKASNCEASDEFGSSLSLSSDGNTLAVASIFDDSNANGISTDGTGEANNSALSSGAVFVFSRSGATWTQQAFIKASNTEQGDIFGYSVSLSANGDTLAVGTINEDSNATSISTDGTGEANNSVSDSGAVYIFSRSGTVWTQQAYVKASNTGMFDNFGREVFLSADGNTLAAASLFEDSSATGVSSTGTGESDNSVSSSGAIYMFKRVGSTWSQQTYVKSSNTGHEDSFGISISLSSDGESMVVGAYNEDSNATGIGGDQTNDAAGKSGAVYLY